jgi:hypothetical protein
LFLLSANWYRGQKVDVGLQGDQMGRISPVGRLFGYFGHILKTKEEANTFGLLSR